MEKINTDTNLVLIVLLGKSSHVLIEPHVSIRTLPLSVSPIRRKFGGQTPVSEFSDFLGQGYRDF